MSSIDENFENNKSLINFPITPIKVKIFNEFEYPSDNPNLRLKYNDIYDNSFYFNSTIKKKLSKTKFDSRNDNDNNTNISLIKVDSTKTFFSKNKINENNTLILNNNNNNNNLILKNLQVKSKSKTEEIYLQSEYCQKYCGEKLFKDLDLNQRFYLKKSGDIHMHHENCKLFKRKSKEIKNSSIPIKFREIRKSEVEKNSSLLDFSLAGVRSKSLIENNNNNKYINNNINNIKNIKGRKLSNLNETGLGNIGIGKLSQTLIEDKSFSKNLNNNNNNKSFKKTLINNKQKSFINESKNDIENLNLNFNKKLNTYLKKNTNNNVKIKLY
jgi:hypothetical protein